ncbi:uncharacterized protein K489DRAFT_153596 [Dissoconium aciculare CBS 342.82]|uniref:Uncharacterized protein n=1 Tax=Dissoconium aciculare CBS 342.82 TaxID=1314786 RepID=A0A6J3MB80_9PEZI|nr:uncharacterized protein K489DRAFT_153596 [Dissoconium aciculare CBS 342.82]KAF1825270.1 hypothetical protein K489DRAFT_153596 [Dissoconium aciculare CBS 342.82]
MQFPIIGIMTLLLQHMMVNCIWEALLAIHMCMVVSSATCTRIVEVVMHQEPTCPDRVAREHDHPCRYCFQLDVHPLLSLIVVPKRLGMQ